MRRRPPALAVPHENLVDLLAADRIDDWQQQEPDPLGEDDRLGGARNQPDEIGHGVVDAIQHVADLVDRRAVADVRAERIGKQNVAAKGVDRRRPRRADLGVGVLVGEGCHQRIAGSLHARDIVDRRVSDKIEKSVRLAQLGEFHPQKAVARGEVAELLGLETMNGAIVVNEFAETSNPLVVAAGDAVLLPYPLGGSAQVRLESVQNAVDQAKVAAATLLGTKEAYHAVPWFWSDQADLKLQIAGLSMGYDPTVLRGNQADEHFSVLYYRESQLIAIDAVNDAPDYMAVRRALAAGNNIPADLASDSSIALKTLINAEKA